MAVALQARASRGHGRELDLSAVSDYVRSNPGGLVAMHLISYNGSRADVVGSTARRGWVAPLGVSPEDLLVPGRPEQRIAGPETLPYDCVLL